ncbi:MAG: DUF973 family protein [Ignisphaera sp.]
MTGIDVREIGIVVDGLRKLRVGVLIQLIVGVIGVYVSVFISIIINHVLRFVIRTNFPWFLSRGILRNILEVAQHMAGFIFIMFVVSLVTIILSIIAIFGYIVPGASCLAKWKSKFYPAIIFMKVGYIGGLPFLAIASVILIISVLTLSIGLAISMLVLYVLAIILLIIGFVGLLILFINLYNEFNNILFLVPCLLLIIRLILLPLYRTLLISNILTIIAWVLIYLGLRESISMLEKKTVTPSTTLV